MRLVSQVGLAIIAIVGLVAGVTFISEYRIGKLDTPTPGPTRTPQDEVALTFPTTIVEWDPPTANRFERESDGHYDYWFVNRNPVPVKLGLREKSCKCAAVEVCVLTPEEAPRYKQRAPLTAAAVVGTAGQGILAGWALRSGEKDGTFGFPGMRLHWQPLAVDEQAGVTVPPQGEGMVRLLWEGRKDKLGPQRLTVDLWNQGEDREYRPRAYRHLELPIVFEPPIHNQPPQLTIEDLALGDQRSVEAYCWSPTRGRFTLTAFEHSHNPCFECACIPLTSEECARLAERMKEPALVGYRVRVTVHERVSDGVQMDLGPFTHAIELITDVQPEPGRILVSGTVRGEITVGAEDAQGKIALGSIQARHGIVRTIRIMGHRPGMKLRYERREPQERNPLQIKYLKEVPPTADGKPRWDLCLEVPPRSPVGPLPSSTAIILQIPGNPPRLARIPVTGLVYQSR